MTPDENDAGERGLKTLKVVEEFSPFAYQAKSLHLPAAQKGDLWIGPSLAPSSLQPYR